MKRIWPVFVLELVSCAESWSRRQRAYDILLDPIATSALLLPFAVSPIPNMSCPPGSAVVNKDIAHCTCSWRMAFLTSWISKRILYMDLQTYLVSSEPSIMICLLMMTRLKSTVPFAC